MAYIVEHYSKFWVLSPNDGYQCQETSVQEGGILWDDGACGA